ncbi:hypothetical protein [Halorubrum distributum]|uniref:Uncharacterized protein n=1 Tax=Halorubrum distributum JCM 13916 TaxID=1230455 RepID=M0PRF8_9EURY|nr:hypothetical protein [Halorubrum arcis]EMA72623.1 hypothetical protein C462_00686 [Halorubrum arcis JCM 13916]
MGSQVGPIIFGNPTARKQLLDNGEVYTFRTSDRTTGDTWARASRTGEKLVDVTVEQVASIDDPSPDSLRDEWAFRSGFGTPEQWWDAIKDVHGPPETGYVYHVEMRNVKRDDVAVALFESRTETRTYRVTLDDERTFEVTAVESEYESVDEYESGSGYFSVSVNFDSVPDGDPKPDRYPTDIGEIAVVETDDGWGTPVLHAAVQHVEDDELVRWEYPTLGAVATIQGIDDGE